jgi:transketolase
MKADKTKLVETAKRIRKDIINMLCVAGSGHSGGSLSLVEVITYLYFSGILNIDPKNPNKIDRDRIVLSKGHGCPVLYAALAEKGYFDKSNLMTLRKYGSILQGHVDMKKTPGVDISAGSLGQGLSVAVGMAIASRMKNIDCNIFAILGDGECNEGQIWEAAMSASHYNLSNLIAIVDRNFLQIDGNTEDVMSLEPFPDKWKAFGWFIINIDGHNFEEIDMAINKALKIKDKPVCIIAHTVKGKGVPFMEGKYEWHGRVPTEEEREEALKCIK